MHVEPPAVEADQRRQILEQAREPAFAEAPRPVGDVAFEQLPDRWPGRLEDALPEQLEQVGEHERGLRRPKHSHDRGIDLAALEREVDLRPRP